MRTALFVGVVLIAGAVCGCGTSSTPASPSSVAVTGGGGGGTGSVAATQIFILGGDSNAFRPSPATAAQGSLFVWVNSDAATHRVVADDGSFDTGDLQPDAQSAPIAVGAAGARYHCANHPFEVGSIAASR